MKSFLRKAKYFLSLRFKHTYENIAWKILKLNIETPTGLKLDLKTAADWQVYNEIFLKGDYDFALEQSIKNVKQPAYTYHFLDLGSNVGFFTLRCADFLMSQKNLYINFKGVLVEGSLNVFKQLQSRIGSQQTLKGKLKLVYGLAGKKDGTAKIVESVNSVTNTVNTDNLLRKQLYGRTVSYIDINTFYNDNTVIDLLKCDVEGSELDFAENYKDLLRKTRVAVFEMHHTKCDTKKCIEIIIQSGLANRKTIFNYGNHTSLEVFWK